MQVASLPLGLLSLWEDELAASLIWMSYHLSRLWCDMICSRLNSRATQSASKTAECQRFGECVYVVSPEQGHLATPSFPTPTVLYLVSQSQPLPLRIDGLAVYAIRREPLIIKPRCGGSSLKKKKKRRSSVRNERWLGNTVGGFSGFLCRYSTLVYATTVHMWVCRCTLLT